MLTSRFELPGDALLAARVCLGQRMPAGDPVRLRAVARRSGAWATDLRRVATTLLAGTETAAWSGAAHLALVEQLRATAPSLTATAGRYEHYAGALTAYAAALDETAPLLFATRNRLRQRYDELAGRQPGAAGCVLGPAPNAPDAAELLPLASTFKGGYDRWADALDRCIAALSEADETDPSRDVHGLAALGHRFAGAMKAVAGPVECAVLHPSLRNLSHGFAALNLDLTALGLGLLFICPAAGAACLAAATVLAAAQLAVDSARRERGEPVSAGSLGMDLAAAIPVGGGAMRGLRASAKVTHLVPGGGLLAHEGLEGGHTLAKHVGKSEAFLRNRLATEPDLKAASTFYDRQTAESGISWMLKEHGVTLNRWLAGRASTLTLESKMTGLVGVVITRATGTPVHANGTRLILKRSPFMSSGFRIHTAMVIE